MKPHLPPQAKRELAKKEGRLLTKKQKEEQRAAEIRKQALLASGAQIEGLQQPAAAASKRPVYGNRKKGGPAKSGSPAPESVPQTPEPPPAKELTPEPILTPESEPTAVGKVTQDVPDDWDASEEEKAPPAADVKGSWDDSSEEEERKPAQVVTPGSKPSSKPSPTPKATIKTVPAKGFSLPVCSL